MAALHGPRLDRGRRAGRVFGPRTSPPAPAPIGVFNGLPGFIVVEREVVRVVERTPPPPAAVPLPIASQQGGTGEKRKPYVIGESYASLPGGCMKMIEGGASHYWCGGGEWYRPDGKQYRAVAKP